MVPSSSTSSFFHDFLDHFVNFGPLSPGNAIDLVSVFRDIFFVLLLRTTLELVQLSVFDQPHK